MQEQQGEGTPLLRFDGAVAEIRFNRPEKYNAFNRAVWRAIPRLVAQVEARRDIRLLVVRGAGGNFAAGADIGEFDEAFADRVATLAYLDEMARATAALEALPLPVVAVIEGLCIGAGVAVALACDMRFAAADARFAITPAKLGVIYSLADSKRLTDAVGLSRAKDLLFSGRTIQATRAAAMGLVDDIFDPVTMEAEVGERLALMTAASPWSIARAKAVVRLIAEGTDAETDETRGWFADAPEGADYREGISAFRTKRKPVFTRA